MLYDERAPHPACRRMTMARPNRNEALAALAAAALAFLRRFPPFDETEEDAMQFVAARLSLGYYPKDSLILSPGAQAPAFLYIIQRGLVEVRLGPEGGRPAQTIAQLGAGECFSVGALLGKRPVGPAYAASSDVFCYQLPADDFQSLLARSARFRDFSTHYLTSLLRDSRRLLRMHASAYAGEETLASRSLRSLVRREPVRCTPETSIEDALGAMHQAQVGSILVVGESGALAGILTRHDVLERIALARRDLSEPVGAVMTPHPRTLTADATAYDAAVLIAREGIRHVPVMESERVIGVVTERDLFALQRASMRTIRRTIETAVDTAALAYAAREIRSLARMLLEQGLGAEQLTYIVSTLNDAFTERVIEIERRAQTLDGIEWAWLAFGSEGRYEQTISTDQDNGIVFTDTAGVSPDAQRDRLLPFARAVNLTLDACGFPLCTGEIMAGNPAWCLSVEEWKSKFERWVHHTDAQELLSSVIFFDLRPIHGARALAGPLWHTRDALVDARPVFLHLLAQFAVQSRPPLGFLGGLADDDPDAPGTIDLKRSAARIFTDAARVMGLAAHVPHTNTAQRLRLAGAQLGMPAEEIGAATEAFFFVQSLRLRTQLLASADPARAGHNRLDPGTLNEVDRRMLKEALRQAAKLQTRLTLDYRL